MKTFYKLLATVAVVLAFNTAPASAQNASPDDVMYILPYWLALSGSTKPQIDAELLNLRNRLGSGGTHVKTGFSGYALIRMDDWSVKTTDPVAIRAALASTVALIDDYIAKAQASGFPLAIAFQTPIRAAYDAAQTASENEDVRNMMWYSDNAIAAGWWTHSRYARKQQAIQEAYIRELGKIVADRMRRFPNVLVAASGDGEQELATARQCPVPSATCLYSDYSPFTIAEFRDWIRLGGLYATGQAFAGQGYSLGARYAGDASPAVDTNADGRTFNGDFGTSFTSWDLKYFDWKLTDAFMSADPKALPKASFATPGLPTPLSGGFDAPRTPVVAANALDTGDKFWDLWVAFKQAMLQRHNIEFAKWMTTSPDTTNTTVPVTRWYSNQIPADYLFGSTPAVPNARWHSAMSSLTTAEVSPYGSFGITSFNLDFRTVCQGNGGTVPIGCYVAKTFAGAAPQIAAKNLRFGLIEWNPGLIPGDTPSPNADVFDEEMALVEKYWPRLLQPFYWGSATQDNKIEGTLFESSLRALIARVKDGRPSQRTVKSDVADNAVTVTPITLAGYAVDLGKLPGGSGTGIDRVDVSIAPTSIGASAARDLGSATYGSSRSDASTAFGSQFAPSGFSITIPQLAPGTYNIVIATRSTVAGTPAIVSTKTIPITVAYPATASPTTLKFAAVKGAAGGAVSSVTAAQVVVPSYGYGTPTWTSGNQSSSWITVTNGPSAGQFTVSMNVAAINTIMAQQPTVTALSGAVTILSANPALSISVPISLTLTQAATSTVPFGSFDTPVATTDPLSGSVAFTGWALDDIGIDKVQLWRDKVAGELTVPYNGPGPGNGKIFIADVVFVKGARPDVEAGYPANPGAFRAGWGYLMLTQGLYNQGNGSFTFYAFAFDVEGKSATLGSKTFAISNSTAIKPFGSIDVPSYGQVMTTNFYNFGWALTPNATPTCTIPSTGVQVSLDSGPLQSVSYGDRRDDIAANFPGLSNTNGAGGAFEINVNALGAGTHQIGWYIVDSCNRADGIGSRFFEIVTTARPTVVADSSVASSAVPVADAARVERLNGGAEVAVPNSHATRVVRVKEDERVVVHLDVANGTRYQGFQVVNGERRRLPVGSSLDADAGIFYWQPAPGFLGAHDLEFTAETPDRGTVLVKARVVIGASMRMVVDTPQAGPVPGAFVLAGWVLDLGAEDGGGVDAVDVWAHPVGGNNSKPIYMGAATYGGSRPDVGKLYGSQFEKTAFDMTVSGLKPGTYDLVVYARRATTGTFDAAQSVRIIVP